MARRHLHPEVYFTIHQLLFGSTAVVIFKIQPCQQPPVRWKETKCVRVGINKKKLRDHPENEHPELALGWRLPQVERIRYDSATSKDAAGGMLRRIREANILIRTILATEASYTYVGTWWPPGHIIDCEPPFVHAMANFRRQ